MLTPYIKKEKPPFNYNRPLSWSQISSFKFRPSQWYSSYVLGEFQSSPEMEFGSMVDKQIQDDPAYLPEIKREKLLQHKLTGKIKDINLVGLPDALDLDNPTLRDYKTGRQKWDKKRADDTGQLTMYLLLIYLTYKIKPEDFECYIDWIPTCIKDKKVCFVEPLVVQTFKTKRTMQDIVAFIKDILDTREKMLAYYNKQ